MKGLLTYTDTIKVLRFIDLAEIDTNAGAAVLTEHLVLFFRVEAVVGAAGAAVVVPSHG